MAIRAETQVDLTRVDDGFSPTATVTKTGDTATITITDKIQTTTASISDGDEGVSITSVKPQYYLSTSSSSATGGSWSDTPQAFVSGMYYWTRDYIDYSDGTSDTSTAVYNAALTQACSDAENALDIAEATNQHFWNDTNGLHIATEANNATAEKNSIWNSLGMLFRQGANNLVAILAGSTSDTRGLAIYDGQGNNESNIIAKLVGTMLRIGKSDAARVEVSPAVVDVIADTGDSALKTETTTTKQTVLVTERGSTEPYFWINGDTGWLRTEIVFSRMGLFRAVAGTTISLSVYLGDTSGKYYTRTFVADTDSYVVIGDYTITYNYTPNSYSCKFVLSGSNIDTSLDAYIVSIQYYVNEYVPSNTLFGVNSLNGIININDVDIYNPIIPDATGSLLPVSSRCVITSGGVFKFGKWRFVQLVLTIKASLSANNTWGLLDGFDLANTGIVSLAMSVNKNYGNVSGQINSSGRLVVQTAGAALAANDVLTVSGWYIAQ